jgi:hypothetical protein
MYRPADREFGLTGPTHECAIDLQDRIVDQQVSVEEAVQRLGIDFLSFSVDVRGKVTGAYPVPFDICLQRRLHSVAGGGCLGWRSDIGQPPRL